MSAGGAADGGHGEVVFLGLGANVGDALATLTAAVLAIDDVDGLVVEDVSGVYRTAPWPPAGDPRAIEQDDFLNLVVRARSDREPHDLLVELQAIETAFGRDRAREQRWGPRVLDVDVLVIGERQIDTPTLVVPHPRLDERAFALVPLLEVWPGGALPDGRRITRLLLDLGEIEDVTLEVRIDGLPTSQIARPDGPVGPRASTHRPAADDVARQHGA